MECFKALLFGILEGITEWLPVSSTGHLILLDRILSLSVGTELGADFTAAFRALFEVTVQLGAIGAVAVRCFERLFPFLCRKKTAEERRRALSIYPKLVLSGIPAAAIGLFGDRLLARFTGKDIDGWLYNGTVVAAALILYGVAFLIPDRLFSRKGSEIRTVEQVGYGTAMAIGCFQALSIVPGTSRSGSTILGGRLLGLSRTAAAEYSFLLAVPTMAGASLIKAADFVSYVSTEGIPVPAEAYLVLAVGTLTAFVVSCFVIDFLMDFVKKHSFAPFGIYRILLGAAVLLFG